MKFWTLKVFLGHGALRIDPRVSGTRFSDSLKSNWFSNPKILFQLFVNKNQNQIKNVKNFENLKRCRLNCVSRLKKVGRSWLRPGLEFFSQPCHKINHEWLWIGLFSRLADVKISPSTINYKITASRNDKSFFQRLILLLLCVK